LNQGEIGKDQPPAFARSTFNTAERNYSTTGRQMAAIVRAVKQFRPHVLGRPFYIMTNHKPLKCVFSVKDPSSRLLRWRLELEENDFKIHYRSGKTSSHADFLSRIHKAVSTEDGERGEESVGHRQADRSSDEGNSTDVRRQADRVSDEGDSPDVRQ
jgi:hypothetical protein